MTTFGLVARRGGGLLVVIGIAALLDAGCVLALPYVMGRIINIVIGGGQATPWVLLVALLITAGITADIADTFAAAACTAGTTAWLRTSLIRHLLVLGPRRTRPFEIGDLVSRVSGNTGDAAWAGPSLVTVGAQLLPPVGSLVLLAILDLWLAAAFVAGVILVALVLVGFARRTAEVFELYQRIQGRIAARLTESLGGARTIAAAGTLRREQDRALEPLAELHDAGMRTWTVLARSAAQAAVVGPFVLIAVLAAGGYELVHGRISPGDLFAASQYAILGAGLGGLTGVVGELARARAGISRVAEVMDIEAPPAGEQPLPAGPGELAFRNVRACEGDTVLLDGVDFVVPGGQAVAVVGHSGAGKSVLAALAGGLREPEEGEVRLDGVPLPQLRRSDLRAAVGCAFERPVLVGHTVSDAIGSGRSTEQIRAAARATHCEEFITRLPDGFDTLLADAPMSGGEAQRLGLARAWHAERLLVLDDATSSLDMVTEMQISHTLTEDRARRTRLIITHRVTTAARADLVVWLHWGRVRAVAPHGQLWSNPAYRAVFG